MAAASLNVPKALGRACLTSRNDHRSSFENKILRDKEWNLKSVFLLEKQKPEIPLLIRISIYVFHWYISLVLLKTLYMKISRNSLSLLEWLRYRQAVAWALTPHSVSMHPARFHKKVHAMASTPHEGRWLVQDHSEPAKTVSSSPWQGKKQSLIPHQCQCSRSHAPPPPAPCRAMICTFFSEKTSNTAVLLSQPVDTFLNAMAIFSYRREVLIWFQFSNQELGSRWEGWTKGLPSGLLRLQLPCPAPAGAVYSCNSGPMSPAEQPSCFWWTSTLLLVLPATRAPQAFSLAQTIQTSGQIPPLKIMRLWSLNIR